MTTPRRKQWQYLDYPVLLPMCFQMPAAKMEELGDLGWEAYAVTRSFVLWHAPISNARCTPNKQERKSRERDD